VERKEVAGDAPRQEALAFLSIEIAGKADIPQISEEMISGLVFHQSVLSCTFGIDDLRN
jgi:hypothetical protein